MRFDVAIPCFFKDVDFCDAVRKVHSLGFDCVETYQWQNLNTERVRATCLEEGVELLSICTSDFRMTDPSCRKDWLQALRESCAAAKALGASRLITQVGKDTGEERARQHAFVVEALKEAKPILEESGLILMIEPLNAKVDHQGYFLPSSKEAFDMIREADHPWVKVVYDIYHQQISEGDILPTILANMDLIAHLHAAGHPGRHELWTGEVNYPFVFETLDRAGYAGACGLEYFPVSDPETSLRQVWERYCKV